jgi:SAM-dependent methyltransferase
MRIGAIPTSGIEWLAVRLNLVPVPAVDALFGMLHSRIIMAGVRLGVFAALATGPATSSALSATLGLQPEGTRLLCDGLVAARYLRRDRSERYVLRAVARRYLAPGSPHYVGHYIEYNYDQWDWLARLEDAIRTGRSLDMHITLGNADAADMSGTWSRYLEGLADLAREAAGEIAAKVPMPERSPGASRTLLDVGGGHGIFSAALCRRYPDLRADVLDLPASVAAGEPIARRYAGAQAAQRIHYRAGDALGGPLGSDAAYDVVLIFQLLHHLPEAQIAGLFTRALAALRPGGWLCIIDLLEPGPGTTPNAATAYTALYFHVTSHGRSYTAAAVEGWLRDAGCATMRRIPLLRVPGQPLIAGQKGP